MGTMEFLLGICGHDFVIVCSDSNAVNQIINMKDDDEKIIPIDRYQLLAVSGDAGDRAHLSELIIAHVKLHNFRNDVAFTTKSIANYTNHALSDALRKKPYNTNLLIAGYDEGQGPSLYYIDHLSTMHNMKAAGIGYGSCFVLSMLDKYWQPEITFEDALLIIKNGIDEVKKRFVVSPSKFVIKAVYEDGIKNIEIIS